MADEKNDKFSREVQVWALFLAAGLVGALWWGTVKSQTAAKPTPCVCESKACPAVPVPPPCSQIDCPSCPDPATVEVRIPLSDELARIWDACAPGVETVEQAYNRMLAELAPLFTRAETLGIKFNSYEWVKSTEARDVASKLIAARDHFFELRNAVFAAAHGCRSKMSAFLGANESWKKIEEIEERAAGKGYPSLDYFYEFFTYEVYDQVQCNLATGLLSCPPPAAPAVE